MLQLGFEPPHCEVKGLTTKPLCSPIIKNKTARFAIKAKKVPQCFIWNGSWKSFRASSQNFLERFLLKSGNPASLLTAVFAAGLSSADKQSKWKCNITVFTCKWSHSPRVPYITYIRPFFCWIISLKCLNLADRVQVLGKNLNQSLWGYRPFSCFEDLINFYHLVVFVFPFPAQLQL